jgi:hypothetical protein
MKIYCNCSVGTENMKRDYGTNGNNGTNGKILGPELFRLFRYFRLFRNLSSCFDTGLSSYNLFLLKAIITGSTRLIIQILSKVSTFLTSRASMSTPAVAPVR